MPPHAVIFIWGHDPSLRNWVLEQFLVLCTSSLGRFVWVEILVILGSALDLLLVLHSGTTLLREPYVVLGTYGVGHEQDKDLTIWLRGDF